METVARVKAHLQLCGVVLLSPASLPVFERQERKSDNSSVDERPRSYRVKALLACNIFAVAHVKMALCSAQLAKHYSGDQNGRGMEHVWETGEMYTKV